MPEDGSPTVEVDRPKPLNLTEDERKALWEMVKVGIGDEEVYAEHHEAAESVHTKVKEMASDE